MRITASLFAGTDPTRYLSEDISEVDNLTKEQQGMNSKDIYNLYMRKMFDSIPSFTQKQYMSPY